MRNKKLVFTLFGLFLAGAVVIAFYIFKDDSDPYQMHPLRPHSYEYQRASEAFNDGDTIKAYEWFQIDLSKDPQNGFSYFKLGIIELHRAEDEKAFSYFTKALQLLPRRAKNARAMVHGALHQIYWNKRDTVNALNEINKAIELSERIELLDLRGRLYVLLDEFEKAEADFRKLIELDPQHDGTYYNLSHIMLWQTKIDDALADINNALSISPDNGEYLAWRAYIYSFKHMWDEAVDDNINAFITREGYNKALDNLCQFPADGMPTLAKKLESLNKMEPENLFWILVNVFVYEDHDDDEKVIEWHKKAIDCPDYCDQAFSYYKMASSYFNQHNYGEALSCVNKAIKLEPEEYFTAYLLKGIIERRTGDLAKAEKTFGKLVELAPQECEGYYQRALVQMGMGKYQQAVDELNNALSQQSNNGSTSKIYLHRGHALSRLGQSDKATEDFKKILELKGDVLLCAYAFCALGEQKQAETLLEAYILREDEKYDTKEKLHVLAVIKAQKGDVDETIAAFQRAVDAGFDDFYAVRCDYMMTSMCKNARFKQALEKWEREFNPKS
jgi:tetratricopeptide (TPR) repeat protein